MTVDGRSAKFPSPIVTLTGCGMIGTFCARVSVDIVTINIRQAKRLLTLLSSKTCRLRIYARLEPGAPRVAFAIKKVFEYSLARNRNPRKGSSLKQRRRSSQDCSQPPRAGENTMNLTAIDWSIIAVYFLISIVIGLHFTRRAG